MNKCEHKNFEAYVSCNRIEDEKDGSLMYVSADLNIKCVDCHKAFVFVGMPVGLSAYHPSTCVDGVEARLPMIDPDVPMRDGLPGFTIKPKHPL